LQLSFVALQHTSAIGTLKRAISGNPMEIHDAHVEEDCRRLCRLGYPVGSVRDERLLLI
jgi:hypothetical protein